MIGLHLHGAQFVLKPSMLQRPPTLINCLLPFVRMPLLIMQPILQHVVIGDLSCFVHLSINHNQYQAVESKFVGSMTHFNSQHQLIDSLSPISCGPSMLLISSTTAFIPA
jgi:hypothetical protein